ncbi:MAG: hypothetical protein Q7T20_09670 [Saprospiraceae bacterium]|nr:hypothetical protein [Saprospiraceae bacterium]
MKNKLVIWGTNAESEKILIALELQAETSIVLLHTFPESIVDEEFVQKMMHEWREGNEEVTFPEGVQTTERELSVTEGLLPETIKADRADLVQRAQTEWHFAVLSAKLYAAYLQELAEFKEKVETLSTYDNKIFTNLRSFWDKVQNQSRERNLFRHHADELRDGINALFEQMKEARKRVNSEFNAASQGVYAGFSKALEEIEERINTGGGKFNSVFDELKKMQRDYHHTRMSNEHRNKLWERLDAAFKKAKERKFGPEVNAGSIADRHDKRLSSLEDAIKRLEESLLRDDEELVFQRQKVNTSEGQLEAQIRGAKIKMIEERANGKRERLAELIKARNDVHRQANSAHEKEARMAAKEAERQQIEAKKAAIKSEIEAETHAKAAAAAAATTQAPKEDSLFEAASNLLGDVMLDALDTAKAVASVAAEKAGEVLSEARDKAEEAYHEATEKAGEVLSEAREKAEVAYSAATEKAGEVLSEIKEKAGDAYSEAKDMAGEVSAKAKEVYSEAKEKAGDIYESFNAPGKEAAPAEETAKVAATEDIIIIDDVVHKSATDDIAALESSSATNEPANAPADEAVSEEKPKRASKKKADA